MVLDEVDKLARPAIGHGRDIGGEGVQQALLKLMEGTTLTVSAYPLCLAIILILRL